MKTVHSFFPTTTKSKASFKKQVTYQVMKKVIDDPDLQTEQKFLPTKSATQLSQSNPKAKTQNIFRDKNNAVINFSLDNLNQRPIGGAELFKKMEKFNNCSMEESGRRLSRKGSKKNIKQSRQKVSANQFKSQPNILINEKDKYLEDFKPETFKVHTDSKQTYNQTPYKKFSVSNSRNNYRSQDFPVSQNYRKCSTSESKGVRISGFNSGRLKQNLKNRTLSSKYSSVQTLKTQTEADKNHIKWATQQQKNYLDKMAILNEINYNRPLIQKLGDRYFEGILRNRYMDEPQHKNKSPFIYQIKDKLADTKFISKIKSMKYNFLERNKITLKGRSKMAQQQEDNVYHKQKDNNNEGRKRWQESNEESFLE